jgi:hypothetical protein
MGHNLNRFLLRLVRVTGAFSYSAPLTINYIFTIKVSSVLEPYQWVTPVISAKRKNLNEKVWGEQKVIAQNLNFNSKKT